MYKYLCFFLNKIIKSLFAYRFIYCGSIELKNLQGPDELLELLVAVDELNIQQLILYIQEFLIEYQSEFLRENLIDILEIVYQHETFTVLLENIGENIYSTQVIGLKTPLFEFILKSD